MKKEKACIVCNRRFATNNDSSQCYDCHLNGVTNGGVPEEGDFNTAAVLAGRFSPLEESRFSRELLRVEMGASQSWSYAPNYEERDDWQDDFDDYYRND